MAQQSRWEFDAEDKFGFVIINYKPFHAMKKKMMVYAKSECQLRMYSGPFELDDFAKLVLACGHHQESTLPGATKACIMSHGSIDSLIGLPGGIPLEVGYSCFACKAGLQLR